MKTKIARSYESRVRVKAANLARKPAGGPRTKRQPAAVTPNAFAAVFKRLLAGAARRR